MRELNDLNLKNKYIKKYEIYSLFDTKHLFFRLYRFEKGEILNNICNMSQWLMFVVNGTFQIYGNNQDGSCHPIRQIDYFTVLGDIEFCKNTSSPFLVEARTTVFCIMLSLHRYRDILLNDNRFLRYLLQSIAEKLELSSKLEGNFSTVEEKFLYYIQVECPEKEVTDVGKAAFQIHCSRRQLQRILKKLIEQNRIQKCRRGHYKFL